MREDLIVIEAYDPAWAENFEEQKAVLEDVVGDRLTAPITHIGSTSVPGLAAKPIIDMLALIDDYEAFSSTFPLLERLGWHLAPEPNELNLRKWSLCFPSVEHRTHHLHVVECTSSEWRDWLLFRDYLRSHSSAAETYAVLKRKLAAVDNSDRVRYRSSKAPFISETMERARNWNHRSG